MVVIDFPRLMKACSDRWENLTFITWLVNIVIASHSTHSSCVAHIVIFVSRFLGCGPVHQNFRPVFGERQRWHWQCFNYRRTWTFPRAVRTLEKRVVNRRRRSTRV